MDTFYFIIKYTPFWAIPLFIISGEFAYIYWLKSIKKVSIFFILLAFISVCFIVHYYVAGGPDRSVQFFMDANEFVEKY